MTMNVTAGRVVGATILIAAGAATAIAIVRRGGDDPAVLGAKVGGCATDAGTATVVSGVHRATADNAPLTVTLTGGRIASVLTPAVRITPGRRETVRAASFTIGRPRILGDRLEFEVNLNNLSGCTIHVGLGRATATRSGRRSHDAPIRFDDADRAVVAPREGSGGSVSFPLEGDGTYELTANAEFEFRLVR